MVEMKHTMLELFLLCVALSCTSKETVLSVPTLIQEKAVPVLTC